MLKLLWAIRRRYHPLHRLRRFPLFRRIGATIDFPVWWRIYGICHPVRLRLIRNLSYLVNPRTSEPEMVALFSAINKVFSPKTFYDIGANIGYYSWLLKTQNPGIAVSLFEPDPINLDLIHKTQDSIKRVSGGIEVCPCAVSDRDGERFFYVDSISGATCALKNGGQEEVFIARHYGVSAKMINVKTVAVDTFRENKPSPELIKIDVEGHETAVVRGARKTLGIDGPIVIFECFTQNTALFSLLNSLGYQLFDAERMTNDLRKATNFLALPARHVSHVAALRATWKDQLAAMGL